MYPIAFQAMTRRIQARNAAQVAIDSANSTNAANRAGTADPTASTAKKLPRRLPPRQRRWRTFDEWDACLANGGCGGNKGDDGNSFRVVRTLAVQP
jgi:hypothetical protein